MHINRARGSGQAARREELSEIGENGREEGVSLEGFLKSYASIRTTIE